MSKAEVTVPSMGESITEVTISQILAPSGTAVTVDMPVLEVESDKATLEVLSPADGVIDIQVQEGDTVIVGATVAVVDTEAKGAPPPEKQEVPSTPPPAKPEQPPPKPPEPQKKESGPSLRQGASDYLKGLSEPAASPSLPEEPVAKQFDARQRRERMPKIRQTIAKRLVQVKNETALLTTFNEVDMTAIMQIRKEEKEAFLEKRKKQANYKERTSHLKALVLLF